MFSHAAAVTQQNYGGRKLPHSAPVWRWALVALGGLVALVTLSALVRRRRRPLTQAAGLRLLDRWLAANDKRPLSIALVTTQQGPTEGIVAAIRPRLRRTDRICLLEHGELLVIWPATSERAAAALREDLLEHVARDAKLTAIPIQADVATATEATTAQQLLSRVDATTQRSGRPTARSGAHHDAPTRSP